MIWGTSQIPHEIDLAGLGDQGLVLAGAEAGDGLGSAGVQIGDFNGDRISDIAVGAPYASPRAEESGMAHVVFGTPTPPTFVDLSDVANTGVRGFYVSGIGIGDHLGQTLASAGDLNGDGLPELLIGAPHATRPGLMEVGEVYLI